MRDTDYARELREPAVYAFDGENEARIERLLIKESNQEEIRFSWWKNGNITTRPLDLMEEHLLILLGHAIDNRVFTDGFLMELRELLG